MTNYTDAYQFRINLDKLWDARKESSNTFSLSMAKACHTLIHNLVEAYKYEDDDRIKEILEELHGSFGFIANLCDYKVYEDRIV